MRNCLPLLALLAMNACAEHHELTACKGPYLALISPQPAVADAPKPAPVPMAKPVQKQTVVVK